MPAALRPTSRLRSSVSVPSFFTSMILQSSPRVATTAVSSAQGLILPHDADPGDIALFHQLLDFGDDLIGSQVVLFAHSKNSLLGFYDFYSHFTVWFRDWQPVFKNNARSGGTKAG